MSLRTFCDRCGAQIHDGNYSRVSLYRTMQNQTIDLCPQCTVAVDGFLTNTANHIEQTRNGV